MAVIVVLEHQKLLIIFVDEVLHIIPATGKYFVQHVELKATSILKYP